VPRCGQSPAEQNDPVPHDDRPDDPTADLRAYLDNSPTPWHAVRSTAAMLEAAGFTAIDERMSWSGAPAAGFTTRDGALIAWRRAERDEAAPIRVVGAHTDSPGLRVKPRPDVDGLGWRQLGVEVYGGVLLNSWLDRDLGVAGRLVLPDGSTHLVDVPEAVARVPQLAIHLDRDVNERGLVLDRQVHLTPVWGTSGGEDFAKWIAEQAGTGEPAHWDLCLFDTQPAAVLGADRTLVASGRLDNLVSCWAAVSALAVSEREQHTSMIALFDHEEVGSASTSGAAGPFLATVIERLHEAGGGTRDDLHRALAGSSCVSADNAHALHPNYPERHDPDHAPIVNHGPAIKLNANQRYATSAETAALFGEACDRAGVPHQLFVSRNNMPCGSTIGPLTATRLGIATVDVGVPQLSMHSARELCGAADPLHLARALEAYLSPTRF
jgi:aspartyl aminopeptidase